MIALAQIHMDNLVCVVGSSCGRAAYFVFLKSHFFLELTLLCMTYEPHHEKTGFLHMRKQRRRSVSR